MSEDIQSRIESLFLSYRESLPSLIEELELMWKKISLQWDADLAAEFDRKVHSLAGSAATFKMTEIGEIARELEAAFKPLLNERDDDVRQEKTEQLLFKLKQLIESSAN